MPPAISTYSIVACDLDAREWGVAVQSRFLAVGAVVPFARAGVGALATQARANLTYGPDGLALLESGLSAEATVARLTRADPGREDRQLGIVGSDGHGATFTGASCMPFAGAISGDNFSAQGNLLESAATVEALADTFAASKGPSLAARLIECLQAAQGAGGDRRGQQSAALLVVRDRGGYGGANDRLVDLRVDDHLAPIEELSRIYGLHELLFGSTPPERWLVVTDSLREEIHARLSRLGHRQPTLADAFLAWVATENLEERVSGVDRIDPVVLAALRSR